MVGNTKEKKILLWVNEAGKDSFFALEAWETNAKKMNMFYKKGQKIAVLAHKVISKGASTGQKETFWCIDDICKVEDDIVYAKKEKKDEEKATETIENKSADVTEEMPSGFANVDDTSDLPFAD